MQERKKGIILETRRKFELKGRTARFIKELHHFYKPSKFNVDKVDKLQIFVNTIFWWFKGFG